VLGYQEDCREKPKYRCAKPMELARLENDSDINKVFAKVFYNLLNGGKYADIERSRQSMQMLFGIFISAKMGRKLDLPIKKDNKYYHAKFKIT
jgi:hypothetical protein